MKYLFIVNDGPYGNERVYNALRLAIAIQKSDEAEVSISLIGDGVGNAINNQKTPDGYYNMGSMLKSIIVNKGQVKVWGSCMDARGLSIEMLIKGAERSTMVELAEMSVKSDKLFVF